MSSRRTPGAPGTQGSSPPQGMPLAAHVATVFRFSAPASRVLEEAHERSNFARPVSRSLCGRNICSCEYLNRPSPKSAAAAWLQTNMSRLASFWSFNALFGDGSGCQSSHFYMHKGRVQRRRGS